MKLSIIICMYNAEAVLEKCLKSLCKQRSYNFEIIMIDDGSTDTTKEIASKYVNQKVKYYFKENGGISSARNLGLRKATGDFITFVDVDDIVEDNYCETIFRMLNMYNPGVLLFGYRKVYSSKKVNYLLKTNKEQLTQNEAVKLVATNEAVGNYLWNKVFESKVIKRHQFPEGRKFEDLAVTLKIILDSQTYIYCNECLYNYIQREDSIMHSLNASSINDAFEFRYKQYVFLKKYDKEIAKKSEEIMLKNAIQFLLNCNSKKYRDNFAKAKRIVNSISSTNLSEIDKVKLVIVKYFKLMTKIAVCINSYKKGE